MTRRRDPSPSGEAGFTLLETLVALAILAIMMVIAWGAATSTMNAKRHFGAEQDRFREARSALQRIVSDIEMAYVSGNEDRTLNDPRTFFIGEQTGDVSTLRFSSFAHQRLYADSNESDQTVIMYYSTYDHKNRSQQNVMRRESRRLANEKPDSLPGDADILFSSVSKLKLSYFDVKSNEWKDTWTTQGADASNGRLPDRVKIALTFVDDAGKELTLTTQAKVHVSEILQFFAN